MMNLAKLEEYAVRVDKNKNKKEDVLLKANLLPIIYEDNHLLVIEKKAGWLSQSDGLNLDKDVLTYFKAYLKEKYQKTGNVYLGLVHRLDCPVAGLLVLAKTSKAASRLSDSIRKKKMDKIYLCLCEGDYRKLEKNRQLLADRSILKKDYLTWLQLARANALTEKSTSSILAEEWEDGSSAVYNLTDFMKKNKDTGKSHIVLGENTSDAEVKFASLYAQCLLYNPKTNQSLCLVQLETGRHHQIRLQFASRSYPLVNDYRYGKESKGQPLKAHSDKNYRKEKTKDIALYAFLLSLDHPTTKERLNFFYLDEKHSSLGKFAILFKNQNF